MSTYVVYRHIAPNGKCYIGITCQPLEQRFQGGRGYVKSSAFYRAIKKYGWENFKHEVLETGLSHLDACEKEREYIAKYRSLTTEFGYNLETGGRSGHRMSEESRRKLSEAHIGKRMPPPSEECRKKISRALTGRTLSPEHKAKISKSKSGEATSGTNNSHPRAVVCVETGVVFDTIKDAGLFTGGSSKNIISCCRGRLKTSGGYHWRYFDSMEVDAKV